MNRKEGEQRESRQKDVEDKVMTSDHISVLHSFSFIVTIQQIMIHFRLSNLHQMLCWNKFDFKAQCVKVTAV